MAIYSNFSLRFYRPPEIIDFSSNFLRGNLPTELGALTNLCTFPLEPIPRLIIVADFPH